MLNLKLALENPEKLAQNCRRRGVRINIDQLVQSHKLVCQLQPQLQKEQQYLNGIAAKMKCSTLADQEREYLILEGRECKQRIAHCSESLKQLELELRAHCLKLPNWTSPVTPPGGEGDGRVLKTWGTPPEFTFTPIDHIELGKRHDLLDFETGANLAGSKFVVLRNQAVFLELALTRFALDLLVERGFTPLAPPDIAKQEIIEGLGFQPRGKESQIYTLSETDLCLSGTSEIALGGSLQGRMLCAKNLPLKLAGISHCFRTEAGTHGRESKGLYRLHQFSKVEMFAAAHPDQSEESFQTLLEIQEEILQRLQLPYRIVEIAAGDLGGPAYRKCDIEAWMPSRQDFGEVTSTSNCTDFQARRLKIRTKDSAGKPILVHTLNGTAIAISRILLAILEVHQRADGSIRIPEKLAEYCGFREISAK